MKVFIKYAAYAALLLLLIAAAAYGIARSGLKTLDQDARNELGGLYLQTENGVLSYTRQGAVHEPTIILVHGFSTPKFVWEQVVPLLLDNGYRSLPTTTSAAASPIDPQGPTIQHCIKVSCPRS